MKVREFTVVPMLVHLIYWSKFSGKIILDFYQQKKFELCFYCEVKLRIFEIFLFVMNRHETCYSLSNFIGLF